MSASTHIPPVGTHCPLSTLAAIRANSSGWRSSIHAYCWACEQTNRYSGYSSIRRTADANVRSHLRRVSRIGHNQAVSMWAWPVAMIRWALDRAGSASAGSIAWRAAATSGTSVEGAFDVAQQSPPAWVVERERAHQPVEDVEVVHQRLGLGVDDDQLGAPEPVQRLLAGRGRRPERRRTELRERRVRGRLDA